MTDSNLLALSTLIVDVLSTPAAAWHDYGILPEVAESRAAILRHRNELVRQGSSGIGVNAAERMARIRWLAQRLRARLEAEVGKPLEVMQDDGCPHNPSEA